MVMRVGFIGLGLMGCPMAHRIARAGYALTVYNRTPAKADGLVSKGATRAATPAEVLAHTGVASPFLKMKAAQMATDDFALCLRGIGRVVR